MEIERMPSEYFLDIIPKDGATIRTIRCARLVNAKKAAEARSLLEEVREIKVANYKNFRAILGVWRDGSLVSGPWVMLTRLKRRNYARAEPPRNISHLRPISKTISARTEEGV